MSETRRLNSGGLIKRAKPLRFRFNDKEYSGYEGDSLASALLANDIHLIARSIKYHRPRGILGLGCEEPNALVKVEKGDVAIPNSRVTQVELYDGLSASSQNCWPSVELDFAHIAEKFSCFLSAGFYYKTFMWPRKAWLFYENIIRRAAGFGIAPEYPDPDRYDKEFAHTDVLIIGGGPAGIAAALEAGRSGARVLLVDENWRFGGALNHSPENINNEAASEWVEKNIVTLQQMDNVTLRLRSTAFGYYEHNLVAIVEKKTNDTSEVWRERIWKVRARQIVLATGSIERSLVFRNNDLPGIMLASAVRGYLHTYGVACGRKAVIITNNDTAYRTALFLHKSGVEVAAVVDPRPKLDKSDLVNQVKEVGIRVISGHVIKQAVGKKHISAVEIAVADETGVNTEVALTRIDCDLLCISGGWTPSVHIHSQAKGKLKYDEAVGAFVPASDVKSIQSVGACAGTDILSRALSEAVSAGQRAAESAGYSCTEKPQVYTVEDIRSETPLNYWLMGRKDESKQFVDFQNDVTVADVEQAVREGYRSVEHVKRYTALGMGTDQGKVGNIMGVALIARELGVDMSAVGVTTYRSPFTPVTLGALVGRDGGGRSYPFRMTAAHPWNKPNGGVCGVGEWQRPDAYVRANESYDETIRREALTVRESAGLMDVSTLGKLDIHGPDATELLQRLYVNRWDNVKIGRGKYWVMLRDDGMVYDDGVTMRLGDDHYYMTSSTSRAIDMVEYIEYLLQSQWPELQVYLTPVTEQWFTVALSGPNSREVLASLLPQEDVTNERFPLMTLKECKVDGVDLRMARLSFCGELSFEISVPADYGLSLWTAILDAGKPFNITPYGVDSADVLRIEKGHIVGGIEANGKVSLDDLGLKGMICAGKEFLGKAALERPALKETDRKQLIGIQPIDPNQTIPDGSQLVEKAGSFRQGSLGFVTSVAYSVCHKRWIGLALLNAGRSRIGSTLYAASPMSNRIVEVEICSSVFYDTKGDKVRA